MVGYNDFLGVLVKNECLYSSDLADFNLYFLLASRVRESALSRYPFSLIHRRLFLVLYLVMLICSFCFCFPRMIGQDL